MPIDKIFREKSWEDTTSKEEGFVDNSGELDHRPANSSINVSKSCFLHNFCALKSAFYMMFPYILIAMGSWQMDNLPEPFNETSQFL